MEDQRIRQLKIKTGVVKRLTKEKESYEKEAVQLEKRLEKMKADGKDEHDIRKQAEVLQESRSMGPSSLKMLRKAYADLSNTLQQDSDLADIEAYIEAKKVLEAADYLVHDT